NDNGVILTAADGRNIVLDGTGANMSNYGLAEASTGDLTSGTVAGVYEGGFTLVASGDTRSIKIDGGYGTGTGDLENSGLARGEYSPATAVYTNEAKVQAAASTGSTTVANGAIKEGDLVINGVTIGASSAADDQSSNTTAGSSDASASGIAIAAAINRSSEQTGVAATVNATEVVGTAGTAAA